MCEAGKSASAMEVPLLQRWPTLSLCGRAGTASISPGGRPRGGRRRRRRWSTTSVGVKPSREQREKLSRSVLKVPEDEAGRKIFEQHCSFKWRFSDNGPIFWGFYRTEVDIREKTSDLGKLVGLKFCWPRYVNIWLTVIFFCPVNFQCGKSWC